MRITHELYYTMEEKWYNMRRAEIFFFPTCLTHNNHLTVQIMLQIHPRRHLRKCKQHSFRSEIDQSDWLFPYFTFDNIKGRFSGNWDLFFKEEHTCNSWHVESLFNILKMNRINIKDIYSVFMMSQNFDSRYNRIQLHSKRSKLRF